MTDIVSGTPFITRAVRASRGSTSLRATIPQVIAATLGLKPGDELLWYLDPQSGSVRLGSHPHDGSG